MRWFRSSAAVLALLVCSAAWGGMVTVYNPQTGKLDYVGAPGVGIAISPSGTISATGQAVIANSIAFGNLSAAVRDKYLDKTGTATAATSANAYKGNSAPSATEFSYLQGVTSSIQSQLTGKADSSSIALVGTTGQYSDLSGKPTIPSALSQLSDDTTHRTVTDTEKGAWNGKQSALGFTPENAANKGNANGYPSLDGTGKIPSTQVPVLNQNTTGTAAGLTAQYIDWSLSSGGASIKNKPALSTVATSGNYSDLNGKPSPYTLPTASTIIKGGVLIDGSSIQIDGAGVIHSTVSAGASSVNGYTGVIDLQTTDITGFGNYSSSVKARLAAKMDNVNPSYSGPLSTTNPDGSHVINVRNTVTRTNTPQEGDMDTDASGRIWLYVSGQWVEKAAPYTLPTASPSTLGGVKTGNTLTIANGVLDVMVSSLGPSGLVTAGLSGNQTISSGFAYVATSTPWKATFGSSTSAKQTTLWAFGNLSGVTCGANGSKIIWANPLVPQQVYSSQCAKLRPGTRVAIQMQGGRTLAAATQNLQKANVPSTSVSPTSLDFGTVTAGSTSVLSATLTNSGLANLVTGSPSITGTDSAKFSITTNGCNAATVVPGATCLESVTFTPGATAGGPYSAQLSIPHNAIGSPTLVSLSGAGSATSYTSNFDSDTVGVLPAGWVNKIGTWAVSTRTPVSGANSLASSSNANGDAVIYTGVAASANMTISASSKITTETGATSVNALVARASADYSNAYIALVTTPANLNVRFYKRVAGAMTSLDTSAHSSGVAVTSSDTYHLKFTVSGSTLSAAIWKNSDTEPSAFYTLTDTYVTGAGYAGIYNTAGASRYTPVDDVAITPLP